MTLRPIPGVQALEYRVDGKRMQRCSKCHAQREQSPLIRNASAEEQLYPIMVGQDLVGILCHECVQSTEVSIQALFPARHAFPFVDERGRLIPNPACERGHALVYSEDGRGMACPVCDNPRRVDLVPVDAFEDEAQRAERLLRNPPEGDRIGATLDWIGRGKLR